MTKAQQLLKVVAIKTSTLTQYLLLIFSYIFPLSFEKVSDQVAGETLDLGRDWAGQQMEY